MPHAPHERPLGATVLALLLGLYAAAAGSLVLGSIALRDVRPPLGLLLLDGVIVASIAATALAAWRQAAWGRRALLVALTALVAVLWAHLGLGSLTPRTLFVGLAGTATCAAFAWIAAHWLPRRTGNRTGRTRDGASRALDGASRAPDDAGRVA